MPLIKNTFSNLFLTKYTYARWYFLKRYYSSLPKTNDNIDDQNIYPIERIRNFSIVAHIDHGKSTLADRLLEFTGAVKPGTAKAQMLDQLQVERERGITVKAVTASLNYTYNDTEYLLNLIDTPGHVDFSNEVLRSVQACQGAILLVDAAEGIQAQTVAVHNLSKKKNLKIIPVLNKIDLPKANCSRVKEQLKAIFNIDPNDVLEVSAKKGWGIEELVKAMIERIPPPPVSRNGFMRTLIFDSWYDKYRGVLCLAYIQNGIVNIGDSVKWLSVPSKLQQVKYISILKPHELPVNRVEAGQVAMIGCGPKGGGAVGDVLISSNASLSDIKEVEKFDQKHMVYAGIYPENQSTYQNIQNAITKLSMNDSAASVSIESSAALGQGWRIGFLGLLHMEVFTQRLLQEHTAKAIITEPSVPFQVKLKGNKIIKQYKSEIITITNPADLPDEIYIAEYYEPFVIAMILTPLEYYGPITGMCMDRRGISISSKVMDEDYMMLQFRMPLCEVITNFHDELKSITSGYATFDYNDDGFHKSALTKLEMRLNGETMHELTTIVHVSKLQHEAQRMTNKLKNTIPRQMIHISIQAYGQGRVLSRENLQAYRKDVTAKLYGGDVTRRMKLLKQQAEGKKKMKSVATMKIPRETLIDILKK